MRVDALCVISAPECRVGEKSGGGRTDAGKSVFGHTMWLHIAVAANHDFPPQRFEHMSIGI